MTCEKERNFRGQLFASIVIGACIAVFLFLFVALPIAIDSGLAHFDCGSDCGPGVHSYAYYNHHIYDVLYIGIIATVTPLIITW